ncbi:uncharacterized protein LOC121995229 [Zingiber officinale]|uniref:uncharacterized protein LOC121995229 n=1 Tax=Zingiber officinale TaxID=94328 RepID=UPI001C4D3D92|nr:uncharacterized protein LOC121995229 [Zingiber officinale]
MGSLRKQYLAKYYTYGFRIASQSYSTSTNRQHRGRSTTHRNQQHENFVINYPYPYRYRGLLEPQGTNRANQNGWDNKHPSRSYFGYPFNHQRLLK